MKLDQLYSHLDRVARRIARDRFLRRSAAAFLLAAAAVLTIWSVSTRIETAWLNRNLATVIVSVTLMALLVSVLFGRVKVTRHAAAREIEGHFADLDQRLLAALEQIPSMQTGRLTFLQDQVVGEALEHARHNNWSQAIPASRLASSALLQFAGLGLFAAVVFTIWLRPPAIAAVDGGTRPLDQQTATARTEFGITVEPGDVEVERGTDLLVLARFDSQVPSDVTLIVADAKGQPQRTPLSKSLDDPVFGGQLTKVEQDSTYVVEYDGQQTRAFQVTVFDFPRLERLDAVIHFPDYTALPEKTLEDTRRVSVVEGTQMTFIGYANKPIASAQLIGENESTVDFTFDSDSSNDFKVTLSPRVSQRYELRLVDEQGRQNRFPQQIVVEIVPNRRPEIKLAFPAKDLRVSPLEELALEASAWDDFGVQQYGLIYGLAGKKPVTQVIGESVPGLEHREISHLLPLEQLHAKPDQLLSYYFYADDFGPDGKIRRTCSDMYFAEVRHFEEIFRQGQQPPGGASKQQGGGSPQAKKLEELAKLQKQIINATWKIIRRESVGQPVTESFINDIQLIADSQQAALDQLRDLEKKLKNPKSKGLVTAVATQMTMTGETLKRAIAQDSAEPLTTAMTSEQAAYQGLLKLRAREHKVSQNKSGGGGGGGGSSRSQQQMNQLELSNKENRYQTEQKAATSKPSAANREQLQVLNRLRDLARRQQGVNEKLKELENALREAKTEQEKEELRRRLKRLRDEQREMLRDVDKLRNRMERPENQLKMAKDRQQLDKTREKIRETSEALKQGQVSKALNSGTRTERELKNLKDDFRKRTAGQFADEMKNLRDNTRQLADKQGELTQQLGSLNDARRRSLRDSSRRQQIVKEMQQQNHRLESIIDKAKDVVRQAEQTEPLLSRKLYETVRKARDDQPGKHLRTAAELADTGLIKEAGESQRQASRGIDRIRQGIEQAADSVLGSESEALRTAKKELDNATKALKNEVAQADRRQQQSVANNPKQTAERSASKSGTRDLKQSNRKPGSDPESAGTGRSKTGKPSSPDQASPQNSKTGNSASAGQSSSGKSSPEKSSSEKSSSGPSTSGQGSSSGKSSSNQKPGLRGDSQSKSSPSQPSRLSSFMNQGGMAGGPGDHGGAMKPLTGDDFRKWSDKLRDVEEMVEDPKLRDEVARVRGRARSMRVEFKRHSREPNWDVVRDTILQPLVELQQRLAQEIARRESKDSLVPIDREPVPDRFSDLVEQYYERLGKGQGENNGDGR